MLDGHGVCIGIKIWNCLILRDPAAIDLVGDRKLPGFVVELDDDVFAKILQRYFGAKSGTVVPDLVGPLLEGDVMRNTAFQRDRVIFRAAGRFAARCLGRRPRGA